MSDRQVNVPKPKTVKPSPITPKPITPKPVTPIKAYTNTHCPRCSVEITAGTGRVRALCSSCDLELQAGHHAVEWSLFDRIVYMPEKGEAQWFKDNYGRVLAKPEGPSKRDHNVVAFSP